MMNKNYYVYILANRKKGTLYIGVTSDIKRRMNEHRQGLVSGFTKRYGIYKLVYIETIDNIESALLREKRLKKWKRSWKVSLIEENNPDWNDLTNQLV